MTAATTIVRQPALASYPQPTPTARALIAQCTKGARPRRWGEVHMSAREQIADRRGVQSPASRSGPAASMSKLSAYLYADSWRCSGRQDMHRVFPFGSRKTWSLNVLPHLVQSNGVVGLATGRRWLLRR